ncbi:acireductone synthase, partial [Pseudomonas sp. MWU12-2323]|uniref:acireductone synthase n=1 Tax=Pseudomonas sp. MWU12-2323 TaxID=2651296 RepID=UPI00128D4A57
QGYQAGQLKGHVYPDAVEALKQWHQAGYQLFVYSSGSIQAQKLIFGCSEAGDLTPLYSGYFDTTSGPKREEQSYRNIQQAIGVEPQDILFLSDIVQKLNDAQSDGLQTCVMASESGELEGHVPVDSFTAIEEEAL